MMIRTFTETTTPDLVEYLDTNLVRPGFVLRRRSVVARSSQGDWVLAISVIRGFPDPTTCPAPQPSRIYDRIRLLEDWPDLRQARHFIETIQAGTITLAGLTLTRAINPSWESEFLAPPNSFMDRVGLAVQTRFEQRQIPLAQEPLISATEPYYPDAASALEEWAELTQHHGIGDSRNGHIVFLLPEARAYFTSAVSDNGVLRLKLNGSDIGRIALIVKGAYRQDGKLRHFEGEVTGDHIELPVPNEVERLEYALIDTAGHVYDLQREMWGARSGLVRERAQTADTALIRQIRDALDSGEGGRIEFKPFIDPDDPPGPVHAKSKPREVLRAIAAFANTEGGTIFLGIGNACSLEGIQHGLAKWGKAEISEELRARYRGALTSKFRDQLVGDVRFSITFATVDDALIAVVSVSRCEQSPVSLRDDDHYYVRRGSNNKHLPPQEWLQNHHADANPQLIQVE